MATVRARVPFLRVLLVLALCLTASVAEQQPTNRYISYAGLPRTTGGGKGAGAPRRPGHSALKGCKDCHGEPPMKATAVTATAESKGTDICHAAAMMTGAKKEAAGITGPKKEVAGITGPKKEAALSEEKRRYISNAALKHDRPRGKCPLPLPSCA